MLGGWPLQQSRSFKTKQGADKGQDCRRGRFPPRNGGPVAPVFLWDGPLPKASPDLRLLRARTYPYCTSWAELTRGKKKSSRNSAAISGAYNAASGQFRQIPRFFDCGGAQKSRAKGLASHGRAISPPAFRKALIITIFACWWGVDNRSRPFIR